MADSNVRIFCNSMVITSCPFVLFTKCSNSGHFGRQREKEPYSKMSIFTNWSSRASGKLARYGRASSCDKISSNSQEDGESAARILAYEKRRQRVCVCASMACLSGVFKNPSSSLSRHKWKSGQDDFLSDCLANLEPLLLLLLQWTESLQLLHLAASLAEMNWAKCMKEQHELLLFCRTDHGPGKNSIFSQFSWNGNNFSC